MLREAQRANSRPIPEFRPAFADDKFSGGPTLDVWEQFRQEIRLAEKYGLKVDPSKCTLYLLAGEAFRGDVSRFQALGVKVVIGANILMLKTPISQDADFLHSFQESKRAELECVFEALERFPRHHVVDIMAIQNRPRNPCQGARDFCSQKHQLRNEVKPEFLMLPFMLRSY